MKTATLGIHDKEAIAKMIAHVESECSAVDTEKLFDEMLDECHSFDSVGGIFACMCPSRVLRECDPVAYRCGMNDYIDSLRLVEIGSENYQPDDVSAAAEEFVDALKSELSEKESERDDLEADEPDQSTLNALESIGAEIDRMESAIDACESHAW